MVIKNKFSFEDAQSMARIAFFSDSAATRDAFWAAAMKSLKHAYGVK